MKEGKHCRGIRSDRLRISLFRMQKLSVMLNTLKLWVHMGKEHEQRETHMNNTNDQQIENS